MSSRLYKVECVVGSKEKDGERYYKVHWKGYPSSEDSWEPEKNLKNCDDLIEEYNQESSQVTGVLMSSDDEAPRTPVRQSKRRSINPAQRSMPRRSLRARLVTETPAISTPVTSTPKHKKPLTVSEPRYNLRKRTSMSSYLATFSSDEESTHSSKKHSLVRKQLHTAPKPVTVQAEREVPSLSSTTLKKDAEPKSTPQPAKFQAASGLQLSYAEFFLALVLAIIVGILYYYNYYNYSTK